MTALGTWLPVLDRVLRPARPDAERCVREGERHREARRIIEGARAASLAECAGRIERARAAVFAANDGTVPRLMTDLEREWLTLARTDPDGVLMDLWARIAPRSWHDHKRWRGSDAAAQLDAAIALASDVPGVEAAESAMGALRSSLGAWGTRIGARVRWRATESETECVIGLLARPLATVRAAIALDPAEGVVRSRSEGVARAVRDAALVRFPARPLVVEGLAHAALVDSLVRAASLADLPNPVTPLRDLWRTGYALAEADASGASLEIPPL